MGGELWGRSEYGLSGCSGENQHERWVEDEIQAAGMEWDVR